MRKKSWYIAALTVLWVVLMLSACGKEAGVPSEQEVETKATELPEPTGALEPTVFSEATTQPEVTATTAPTPTPTIPIPEDIVDTSKEPYLYEELCEDVRLLAYAYPEIVSVSWEGESADGRAIPAVLFGNPDAEQTVFIQAAIHGREHLTALLVMEQLEITEDFPVIDDTDLPEGWK